MEWWLVLILMVISALCGASIMGMYLLDKFDKLRRESNESER